MSSRRVLPALALAVLVAGCGGGGGNQAGGNSTSSGASATSTGPGATTTAPGTSTPTSTTDTERPDDGSHSAPPFVADTKTDTGTASAGARGTITDVRIGHHDGFDRVVFEFHGKGTPGWTARYVSEATSQGSGQPIHLDGKAVLSVAITGVGYPTDTGIQEFRRGAVVVAGTDVVTEAFFDSTFEGISQAFVGTTAQRPFRVYLLTDPARVVVEVREH